MVCERHVLEASQAGVDLAEGVLGRVVGAPVRALLVELGRPRCADAAAQVADAFQEVDAQAARHVPGDVAVHQPGARVVGLEAEDEPAAGRQHGNVTTDRVVAVQVSRVRGRVEVVLDGPVGRCCRGPAEDNEVVTL